MLSCCHILGTERCLPLFTLAKKKRIVSSALLSPLKKMTYLYQVKPAVVLLGLRCVFITLQVTYSSTALFLLVFRDKTVVVKN